MYLVVNLEVISCCAGEVTLCVNERLLSWMGEQVYFEVVSLCAMCMSSCIVCKHRASLPSVWLYKTHCVPWGSQAARRRGCTVCKKNATFHCVLDRPQSLFYFVPQEISQLSMIGYCVPPCVFSVWKHGWLSSRTGCSCRTSFHNAESCVFWDLLSSWRRDHTEDMSKVCLQFVFQCPWLVLRSGVAMVLLNQSGS